MAVAANKIKRITKKIKSHDSLEEMGGVQASLFEAAPLLNISKSEDLYPIIYRTEREYRELLLRGLQSSDVGFDIETEGPGLNSKPTILGIGFFDPYHPNYGEAASVPWNSELCKWTVATTLANKRKLVGHNVVPFDRPQIQKLIGQATKLSDWYDTLLSHYAANMHLTKVTIKDEDEEDAGVLGLMNLWIAMRAIPLPIRNWKVCRGADCQVWGGPCPIHRRFEYNAVDSWAGAALKYFHEKFFAEMQIPPHFMEHLHKVALLGFLMQREGIKINLDKVEKFDNGYYLDVRAFGVGQKIKMPGYFDKIKLLEEKLPFNPRSEKQIIDWFDKLQLNIPIDQRYSLKDTRKATIQQLVDDLSEAVPGYPELETLFYIKASGKGSKSWFNDKYFQPHEDLSRLEREKEYRYFGEGKNRKYSYIHPRWNGTGTATLRLSSSKPNAMNIPARGPLAPLRDVFEPPPGYEWVKADAKQLEVRIACYDYGVDPNTVISLDPFTELVKLGNGVFEEVADKLNTDPKAVRKVKARDIAKMVAHGATNGVGLDTINRKNLDSKRMKTLEDKGAIRVFYDWELGDEVVYATGIKVAQMIFGTATDENRKKAIELQYDLYYKLIKYILPWQQRVSKEVFDNGYVRGLGGSILWLDSPETKENFKAAFSVKTQGGGAYFMRSKMIEDYERYGRLWTLMVHDEMDTIVPVGMSDLEIYESFKFLEEESQTLPGLKIPFEMKRGTSWMNTRELKLS